MQGAESLPCSSEVPIWILLVSLQSHGERSRSHGPHMLVTSCLEQSTCGGLNTSFGCLAAHTTVVVYFYKLFFVPCSLLSPPSWCSIFFGKHVTCLNVFKPKNNMIFQPIFLPCHPVAVVFPLHFFVKKISVPRPRYSLQSAVQTLPRSVDPRLLPAIWTTGIPG